MIKTYDTHPSGSGSLVTHIIRQPFGEQHLTDSEGDEWQQAWKDPDIGLTGVTPPDPKVPLRHSITPLTLPLIQ